MQQKPLGDAGPLSGGHPLSVSLGPTAFRKRLRHSRSKSPSYAPRRGEMRLRRFLGDQGRSDASFVSPSSYHVRDYESFVASLQASNIATWMMVRGVCGHLGPKGVVMKGRWGLSRYDAIRSALRAQTPSPSSPKPLGATIESKQTLAYTAVELLVMCRQANGSGGLRKSRTLRRVST